MYSGGESTDSQKYTQWAMNPAAYQNTPNDQVDWAALAHQWIIMKEAGPPPIPGETKKLEKPKLQPEPAEGGEAEMDMEKDDAHSWSGSEEAPPAPGAEAWNNWNPGTGPPGPNWNWSGGWNASGNVPPPHLAGTKPPLLPTPNRFPDSASDNATPYASFTTAPPPTNNQPAFWTGMSVGKITQTEIKPHNKRYSKVNVPTKVTIITPAAGGGEHPPAAEVSPPVLDTNKRKQLPAWIREGLEKMERDKLKQLEREKEKLASDEIAEKMKLEEKEKMEILRHTIKEKNLLRKSRFDSDNENSDEDRRPPARKTTPPPPVPLTPEELMLKVRKTMTEILLKVTNEQIEQVCKEERQRYIKKRKASDQLASAPSGALIKAKLGLGAYDDGSSSDEDSDLQEQKDDSSDSETDLKDSIKKRQTAFSKTEQEIKDRLAEAERRRERSRSSSSSSSADSRDKSQVEQANAPAPARRHSPKDDESTGSSNYLESKARRRSSSSSRASSRKPTRRRSSRSSSSRRDRSAESYSRRGSTDSRKRNRRSGSRYSKRSSRRTRSRSRSPYSSRKRSRYSRRSRSRSRSSRSKRSRRSRSRSYRKRSRSSSRGKRSRRR